MRCSICGGHLTNQRCDDCGMIFPPEDRYTLHHTEDPNCPSHVEPGQKARPVSLAADLKIHAHAQYVKPVGPTGVRLFGYDHITNLNVHSSTAFL